MAERHALLFALGRPLSPFYGAVMSMRAKFYENGWFRGGKVAVPVVSIGNLTMGGTGKTPMVIHVCRQLKEAGMKPAVVSRGYRGSAGKEVNIVSDGRETLLSPAEAGDEPRLLADALPGLPVLTGARRLEVARLAVSRFPVDVIVLDDGFQHLALQRDLNIVLFHADSPLGNSRVFPGGQLREPLAALDRADAFVITGVAPETEAEAESFRDFLESRLTNRPVFFARYRPCSIGVHGRTDEISLEQGKDMKLFGFCGLANPRSFRQTLELEGFRLTGFTAFKDHHPYSLADMKDLALSAQRSGAQGLITTEKDFVKIREMKIESPLLVLKVALIPEESFDRFVLRRMKPEMLHTP